MTSSSRPRVAAYLRISKDDDRSTSIEKQRANVLALAASRWPGVDPVEFVDRGVSATKVRARPAFADLTARLSEFDVVVFDRQDRIARRPLDFWTFAAEAERHGTSIVGASEDLDLSTADGELTAGVRLAVARAEARRTGERVKATNEYRRSQGRRSLGGGLPYGLRPTADGRAEPDPIRAPFVIDAAERIASGEASVNSLANEWARDGRPAHLNQLPREQRETTEPPLSHTWSRQSLGRLLRNPAIAGQIPDRGGVLYGADGLPIVEPSAALISLDLWNSLQHVLDTRVTARRPAAPRHEPPLLDGLVRCAEGHPAYPHRQPGRPTNYTGRKTGCRSCTAVNMDLLDAYVIDAVLARVGRFEEVREVEVTPPRDTTEIANVRAEITRTIARLQSAPGEEVAALAERLTALKQREANLGALAVEPEIRLVGTGRTIREAFESAESIDDRRDVIAAGLDGVIVFRGSRGGNRRSTTPASLANRVRILWTGSTWEADEDLLPDAATVS